MPEHLAPILADLRRRLEALYGPRLVRLVLFGSQARGDAEPGSDIDVLVVLEGPVNASEEIERAGNIVADVSLEYDVSVSCAYVSVDRYAVEHSPLLMNIRREGVAV